MKNSQYCENLEQIWWKKNHKKNSFLKIGYSWLIDPPYNNKKDQSYQITMKNINKWQTSLFRLHWNSNWKSKQKQSDKKINGGNVNAMLRCCVDPTFQKHVTNLNFIQDQWTKTIHIKTFQVQPFKKTVLFGHQPQHQM